MSLDAMLKNVLGMRDGWKHGSDEELRDGLSAYHKQKETVCPFNVGDIVFCHDQNSKTKKGIVVEVCEPFVAHLDLGAPILIVNMYVGTMAGACDEDKGVFKVFSAHSDNFTKAP